MIWPPAPVLLCDLTNEVERRLDPDVCKATREYETIAEQDVCVDVSAVTCDPSGKSRFRKQ